ncbi:MAG: cysteine desulfurase NifS [Candidatus Omnitrophota bacterium]
MKRIYLDYAATTPTDPEVVKTMLPYFTDIFGNPSSIHSFGQETKAAIEGARETIASLIGAAPEEIIFTSGGTESNNFALKGLAYANQNKGNHIITSSIEHHAVIEPCKFLENKGFKVTYLPVDKDGLVDPEQVKKAITPKTILISIMYANNEIGTIEPIGQIGKITREREIYFHTDAVQVFGHIPINVDALNVDLLSISAHKLCGPKGIGALYVRKGTKMNSFMHGGEQERRRRASTENVPAIVGFGKAAEIAKVTMAGEEKKLTLLRDKLIKGIFKKIDYVHLNGHQTRRLPNNVNLSVEFIEGESMLLNLDLEGIAASTGSACSSSSLEPSHVLLALGLSHELAHGSLRFTMGRYTREEEVNYLLEILPKIVDKLRAMSPLYKKENR